ncbi:MAG: hypothetical protein J6I60_07675 [Bacteroidaceae bacterium]|nr:hypothetical protein [Bacteroidaceae bacterium]
MFSYRRDNFPICIQHDTMQCGVACLSMILAHLGKKVCMEDIEKVCHPTQEGVSLLALSETAEHFGIHTTCEKLSLNELKDSALPCIIHWNQNHFLFCSRKKTPSIIWQYSDSSYICSR